MLSPVSNNLRWLRVFSLASSLNFYHSFRILYFLSVTDSYTLAASIFTILMLTTAAAEVPTGVLSDRLGRKQTMVLGAACSLASLLLYATATGYPFLVGGALLAGLAIALYSGNNDALLYDTLPTAAEQTISPRTTGG